jgi:hypothetical protein
MNKEIALAVIANDRGRKELSAPTFKNQVNRIARFHEVLQYLEAGPTAKFDKKYASALADIRIRDAVIRKMYDLHASKDLQTLASYRLTLEEWASKTSGTARLSILAIWAGSYLLDDVREPMQAVLEAEDTSEYSLWQLLGIAQRQNVPASVWGASLKAVSLDDCLAGAE